MPARPIAVTTPPLSLEEMIERRNAAQGITRQTCTDGSPDCAGWYWPYVYRRVTARQCWHCGQAERIRKDAASHQQRRIQARAARVADAPPCPICGAPLFPADATRARRDRVTCSDRCRQALRRQRTQSQPPQGGRHE